MKPYFAFQWHITDECDQRCRHCYIFSEDGHICLKQMGYGDMERVAASCMELCERLGRTPYFYITGGDPILHKDFWKLCELLKSRDAAFGILGNPFHLTGEVCERLYGYGCRKYQLSLDGMRETHDKFRKSGSFDVTIEKIACIRNAGMYCAVMSTVSCANQDEFPALIDLVVDRNVDVFAFGRYCPTSGQENRRSQGDDFFQEYHIPPLAYRAFLEKCWQKYEQYKNRHTTFQLKDHLWTLFLYEKGIFKIPETADKKMIYDGCHCAISHMTILPTGDVYACRRMESKIGNVFDTSMYDLFMGVRMEKYRDFDKFEKCGKCELRGFCRGCPAVAYGYTGNMYAPDPQCWKAMSHAEQGL